ncbi:type I polyketide synthase [Streptomyces mirabilis]|uniref:type I polyketide synthase n=1 Tax=Streptomyces mirabilis TaxID=68239 RepID=UPI00368ED3DB
MSEAKSTAGSAEHDIAVIGMACRFPGGVRTPEDLWRLSMTETDAITEIPESRWRTADLYAADPTQPGMISTKWAGCIEDIDRFDAEFFGISPREAAQIDPQQRLLLETAHEAMETAGAARHAAAVSGGGVFVGISGSDYGRLLGRDLPAVDAHFSTGQASSIAANRLSYVFGMAGPSLAVDTACSSSLVAVHLAVRSLRAGDCRLALAAGVNLVLAPDQWVSASKAGMMSPTGRCRSFGAGADGFVRSDGCGVLVLKPLALAEADGDHVLGVIRGSAVNQDGRSNGLTAPNGPAQEAVIRAALADAGIGPEQVGHVEAHGSGTPLGDPIEIGALAATYGRRSPDAGPCVVSSVKSNLGHSEAAAGMAGLIRLLLCLREGQVPATLHTRDLNPGLPLDGTRLVVAQRTEPWSPGHPRVGSVSSFGFGGTNAHIVVQQAAPGPHRTPERHPGPLVLPLSAVCDEALRTLAARYLQAVDAETDDPGRIGSLCYSAAAGRRHRPVRAAFTGADPAELRGQLESFSSARALPRSLSRATGTRWRDTVFVFSGQGQKLTGAGTALLVEPAFAEHAQRCARTFDGPLGISVLDLLTRDDAAAERELSRTDVAQALLFTVQSGLALLWGRFGLTPAAVMGHSAGETAAAHAAGLLDFDAAADLVLARGTTMQDADDGRMVAVSAPAEAVTPILDKYSGTVVIAVENAPRSVVVSGPAAAVTELTRELHWAGHHCRPLPGRFAFHSPVMADAATALERSGAGAATGPGGTPLFSSVTGSLLDSTRLDATHWARGLAGPVRFREAVQEAVRWGFTAFLEIGPRPTLGGAIRASAAQADATAQVVHAACPEDADLKGPRGVLPDLYVRGADINWQAVYAGGRFLPGTPTYPWQRESHWAVGTFLPAVGHDCATPQGPAGQGQSAGAPTRVPDRPRHDSTDLLRVQEPSSSASSVSAAPSVSADGQRAAAPVVPAGRSVGSLVRAQLDVMQQQLALLGRPRQAQGAAVGNGARALPPHRAVPAPVPVPVLSSGSDSPAPDRWPVSAHQRELWELCRRSGPEDLAYNETVVLAFRGRVETEPLRRALRAVCRRHPALRAVFTPDGTHLVVADSPGPDMLRAVAEDDSSATAAVREFADAPFDLAAGPLFRTLLVRRGADRSDLVLSAHHLVFDGTSVSTVLADLATAYEQAVNGADPVRDAVPRQPGATTTQEGASEELVAYWRGRLDGHPAPVWATGTEAAASVRPGPPTRQTFRMEQGVWDALTARCPALRSTPFMVAFSAFTAALHRLSGRDDLVVGVPVDQRQDERERGWVGHFVNYVPVRSRRTGPDFLPHHRRTSRALLEDMGQAGLPLHGMLEALEREGAVTDTWAARRELTSVVFDLNPTVPDVALGGARGEIVLPPVREAKFDLFFDVIPVDGAVLVDVIHRAHVPVDDVRRLWTHWHELIRQVAFDTMTG